MRLLIENIKMQGDFACDAIIRYGDVDLEIGFVGNELLLPEFIKIPLELQEQIRCKILQAMCRERRKVA